MAVLGFYPWHQVLRDRFQSQHQANHLAHALLFSGAEHLGKRDFALALAARLICKNPTNQACGVCKQCHLIQAGTHPDLRLLEPEADATQIKIAQVRHLIDWINQTAQFSGYKIAIIHPAQQMNVQSANALLKCIEEPAANTLVILITPRPASLLPTIRSRCQQYPFAVPEPSVALDWLTRCGKSIANPELMLSLAGGIPLAVIRKFDRDYLASRTQIMDVLFDLLHKANVNPVERAAKLSKFEAESVFQVMQEILADCIRFKSTHITAELKNQDVLAKIEFISSNSPMDRLYSALDRAGRNLGALRTTANPNKLLLLERYLIDYQQGKLGRLGCP